MKISDVSEELAKVAASSSETSAVFSVLMLTVQRKGTVLLQIRSRSLDGNFKIGLLRKGFSLQKWVS